MADSIDELREWLKTPRSLEEFRAKHAEFLGQPTREDLEVQLRIKKLELEGLKLGVPRDDDDAKSARRQELNQAISRLRATQDVRAMLKERLALLALLADQTLPAEQKRATHARLTQLLGEIAESDWEQVDVEVLGVDTETLRRLRAGE